MVLSITACGRVITNAKIEFSQDLSATILEFDDPETIKKGVPAYLILISSMIKGDPDNPDLLESGAKLYGSYASGFSDSDESKKALSNRAFHYASRAMCLRNDGFCDVKSISYFEYERRLNTIAASQVEPLFIFVSSWAGVIEANSSDWNAVAELPKVKAGILRVIDIDETVNNGNAHLYMAVMESLLPPTLGGKPELAQKHFDRAIEISNGENQMARVLYAEKYARMMFDRELHDKLLKQVVEADSGPQDQILINTLAKQRAAELLLGADDYF
ncbi:MAG: TRAP transporter TatT component family protein [Gammaproteobacteria bacterium]|nr:TRAP transporter TatT component family protein [Gammaproteobacteria bacterium]MCW8942611.1 TRAP transporter TatT component family protein [Gammaproteobacteria bacterium]